jgi:hypothetical protein
MEKEDIKKLTDGEMNAFSDNKKEVQDHLVEPFIEPFEDIDGNSSEKWVVFKKEEFLIVYDEQSNGFGLAFKNIFNQFIFLGNNGSFFDAYENLISRE